MTDANTWTAPHGGWTRHDVTDIVPLGAYPARQCPVRTQWDVVEPAERAATPPDLDRRAQEGIAFEQRMFETISSVAPDAVQIVRDGGGAAREAATVAALRDGAPIVLGGRLPIDERGRRVAEPDVLVRVGDEPLEGTWRYRSVDVKHHSMLTSGSSAAAVDVRTTAEFADLRGPDDGRRTEVGSRSTPKVRNDLLQLAHYHRTLDACGHAADGPVWGGVLGSEEQVVWYRLDEPMWQTPASSEGRRRRRRTSLAVYDFEFGFRLDIAAVAQQHLHDPSVPLLVEPVWISECATCPWRDHCRETLERRGDVSLLPGVGWRQWSALRDVGATSVASLAELDPSTELDGVGGPTLHRLVNEARARVGTEIACLRPGVERVELARADVEVDVDMENADEVYLWGAYVTDRVGAGLSDTGYVPFDDWSPDLDESDAGDLFLRFWNWLTALREDCHRSGHTFAAWCWSGPGAEERWMRHYGELTGVPDEVEAFLASSDWVDLERVFREQLITGSSTSLKKVARLVGFRWEDEDPGGAQSMNWYRDAVDPGASEQGRAAQRKRLLTYNEDDVRATAAIRAWLEAAAPFKPLGATSDTP